MSEIPKTLRAILWLLLPPIGLLTWAARESMVTALLLATTAILIATYVLIPWGHSKWAEDRARDVGDFRRFRMQVYVFHGVFLSLLLLAFAEAADRFAALGHRDWQGSALLRRGYSACYQHGDLAEAVELIGEAVVTYPPDSMRLGGALAC